MSQYVKKIRTEAGDLQIDYNALANLPTISNPNLLDNANFKEPVNQRNQETYSYTSSDTKKVYTIDRWWINGTGASLTFNDGHMSVYLPSHCDFGQGLDVDYTNFNDVTVSVKFKDDSVVKTATVSGLSSMQESTEKFVNLTSAILKGFFVFGHGMYMFFRPTSGAVTMNIEWIKLENGPVATPFIPKPYQQELFTCQHYYRILADGFFIGLAITTVDSIVMPITGIGKMYKDDPSLYINNIIFNPLSENRDLYIRPTAGYARLNAFTGFVSLNNPESQATVGSVGRIYGGTMTLDAEMY